MSNNYDDFTSMYSIVYEEEYERFVITYDDDKELTYLENDDQKSNINMEYDYGNHQSKNKKLNMMWIADIKKHYNWKQGEVLRFCFKQNCDNCFYIYGAWHTDDDGNRIENTTKLYDMGIDDDGFVVKRYFQYYKYKATTLIPDMAYYIRVNSVYNDYMVDNDSDTKEEEEEYEGFGEEGNGICKECEQPTVDPEDRLCHCCYHKSCDEGECYCEEAQKSPFW